ncbi:MAG: mevalonate-3-phosphate 5-kinase [Ferroplasma sp.]|jgi:mevalonate-3-phosphate-5-kinase|uniref:mevalonate-3-phosphate 5-kinase n=1 Tax=Ferroplasma sp. TaxID=2591003 RepID=UPI0028166A32|nr:mevalonate-3-phosphate 5-kinase [Ferroplasma sp.]WMT51535.1 MAG: mevalonate-3-phosphate 5-kinase [Ferroplasma sp.]
MIPVVLIGGIPGVGKTSISGYIGREFNINIVLSGDYLREFLRPYAESGLMEVSVYSAYSAFGEKNNENIIKGYVEQSKSMYPGINAIFRRALRNGEPLILETLYFIPEMLDEDIRDKIIKIYIHISDMDLHSTRLKERINYTHLNSPGERLVEQLPVYSVMEKYSMERSGSDVLIIDNKNFHETETAIKEYIKSIIGGKVHY